MPQLKSTFVVIGSGVAGLKTALDAAEYGDVALVTKKEGSDSNTNYAQGGIASVLDPDDKFESHIEDTMKAGAELCHRDAVELIVKNGPEAIQDLIEIGVNFTRDQVGNLELGKEGGHSSRRIVHAKDLTGREVERALLADVQQHPTITTYEHHFAIDLIVDESNRCWGVTTWDDKQRHLKCFVGSVTLLATGGCGRVYRYTTNPTIATGDGVAMAYRAGAPISNMEFIQFHPTAFYEPNAEQPFLISEAVRGEGAILRTADGVSFMEKHDPERQDLAPRDIVARAIDSEMKSRGEACCYLDVRDIDQAFFVERFPSISAYCESKGLNLSQDMIPVVPAAHYMCGGVMTDLHGATSLKGLYCTGESSCTGVHGANRLASNSILEALVFSKQLPEHSFKQGLINEEPPMLPKSNLRLDEENCLEPTCLNNCRNALQGIMWDYVGIVRSDDRLKQAHKRLCVVKDEIESYVREGFLSSSLLELRNIAQTAELIILCALNRKESRGLHFTLDYPGWREDKLDTVITRQFDGTSKIRDLPVK